jgi:hypothetical protein
VLHIPHLTLLVRVEVRPIPPEAHHVRISFHEASLRRGLMVREKIVAGARSFSVIIARYRREFCRKRCLIVRSGADKRTQKFLVFTIRIGFLTAENAACSPYMVGIAPVLYSAVYWSCVFTNFLLELGVVMEWHGLCSVRLGHGHLTTDGDFWSLGIWALSLQQV